jgi:hypothetical protein
MMHEVIWLHWETKFQGKGINHRNITQIVEYSF